MSIGSFNSDVHAAASVVNSNLTKMLKSIEKSTGDALGQLVEANQALRGATNALTDTKQGVAGLRA